MAGALKQVMLRSIQAVGGRVAGTFGAGARRREGLAPPTNRSAFLRDFPLGNALEIGPFDNPTIAGPGVSYFDVLDAPALKSRAAAIGYGGGRIPERIDFVSPTGDLSVIDRSFDAALSSHVIEHQPDLVQHLRGVEAILKPGGAYHLIVPDRRYTFDHFLPETSVVDVEQAHVERRRTHTRASILDHRLGTTHNNPLRHWLGLHGKPRPTDDMRRSAQAEADRSKAGEYVDVHAWAFSPHGFLSLMGQLRDRGLTGLVPERVHATSFGDLEFFAVLRLPK